ncbi:MAG TPA: hypothetical protein VEX37_00505, partial [Thermomicrobiales bacterium]|nr:hypothetical protein [Thermomicrobiales bacterium]
NLRQLGPTPPQPDPPIPNRVLTQGSPAWSPDGTKIAFASSRAWDRGGLDIYVVNADGSDLQRLTDDPSFEESPRWSPDGSMIAFEVHGDGGDRYGNIYVMNSDGSERRRLVEATGAGDPNWSPDGEWIAYSDGRFCCAVHIVRVDGTDRRDLSGTGFSANWPRWSPDGSMLAWSAHSDGGSFDGLLILDRATDDVRHISSLAGSIEWSPDGRWIVVARHAFDTSGNQLGEAGLYVLRPDGSDERLLLDIPVDEYDTHIDWRPATTD